MKHSPKNLQINPQVTNQYNYFGGVPELPPSDADLRAVFAGYCDSVAAECELLEVAGLPIHPERGQRAPGLEAVYVALETRTPVKGRAEVGGKVEEIADARTLTAWEALFLADQTKAVFIGEPGSGKSTFVQHVALRLARNKANGPAPFRIILRHYEREMPPEAKGTAAEVMEWLKRKLEDGGHRKAAAQLPELLERGAAVVFFDGLDEAPADRLSIVRKAIVSFATGEYRKCRVVVTCRIASYERAEARIPRFPEPHQIVPLSDGLQDRFIAAWYHESRECGFLKSEAEQRQCERTLRRAIKASEDLQDMAGNPFFLTVMATLHRLDKPLPDTGAMLMDQLVDGILRDSRKIEADGQKCRGIAPDPDTLRSRLETIAFNHRKLAVATHRKGDAPKTIPVSEDLLRNKLRLDRKWTDDDVDALVDALRDRAGLLQSRDGKSLEFHYRFEEFLAGCHLTNEQLWPERAFARRVLDTWVEQGDYARKTVLWAAGVCAHARRDRRHDVISLIQALIPAKREADDAALARLLLAAEIARDSRLAAWDDEDVPRASGTAAVLRERLESVRDGAFPHKARATAAAGIGVLGDLRPGTGCKTVGGIELPDIAWCDLPAGPFPMGDDQSPYNDEKPGFSCRLIAAPYRISKYPVTAAQYGAFIAAGGYGEAGAARPEWWTESGWKWLEENRGDSPKRYESIFQTPNHPRVGVTWYEAHAFTRWMHAHRIPLGLPEGATIDLPSEAQWERAARGTDEREYPWGNQSSEAELSRRCNCKMSEIGHTSAVGLFPEGRAECGAEDLAGNVWEWCATKRTEDYRDYEVSASDDPEGDDLRVLRGGSWFYGAPGYLRAAGRYVGVPGGRNGNVGFRVVCGGVAR